MELRKDYVLNRWAIIAKTRSKRPHQFKQEDDMYKNDPGPGKCFFCPGNEDQTPPEWGRIGDGDKGWKIRWFKNKFAAVESKGKFEVTTDNKYFTFSNAYGHHEVIVETPDHTQQMWDYNEEHLAMILKVYANRIDELGGKEHIKYVNVFKNHGKNAGTSIVHAHSQVISLNIIPHEVELKLKAIKKFEHCHIISPYQLIIFILNILLLFYSSFFCSPRNHAAASPGGTAFMYIPESSSKPAGMAILGLIAIWKCISSPLGE